MKLRKAAVCALLSLMMAVQAMGFEAAAADSGDNTENAAAAVGYTSEDTEAEAEEDTDISLPAAEAAGAQGMVFASAAEGMQKEQEYLAKNPELAELGEHVFEGDTLPCSENDPSYHKYVTQLMNTGKGSGSSLSGAGLRILSSTVYNSDKLVHQERFADCKKTYGIDVSYYQGNIDWDAVKAEGFSFAILRVGFRGYGAAGTLVLDEKFLAYIKGAKAAGLDVGVYFYTQAITTAEAEEEADFVYKYIKGYSLELPVYFDMETVENAVGRLDAAGLSKAQKTALYKAFCEKIRSYGYQPGVYTNYSWYTNHLNGVELAMYYPIWFANYTLQTKYTDVPFNIWQYGYGVVNGIKGYADLNVKYDVNQPPDTITDLAVSGKVSTKAKLTWTATNGSSAYSVYKKTSSGEKLIKSVSSTTASVELGTGFEQYYVKGYYLADKKKIYSEASNILYLKQNAPSQAVLKSCTTTTAKLAWNGVTDASQYAVQLYNEDTGKYYNAAKTTSTSYTLTGLTPGTKYRVRIRCYFTDDSGTTTTGNYGYATTFGTKNEKVSGPKFISKTESSVSMSWNKAKGLVDGYIITFYSSAAGKYLELARTNASTTSTTITGLEKGTIYFFKVAPYYVTDTGEVVGEESDGLLCATKCDAPTGPACTTDDATGKVTFTWNKADGANGYMLYLAKTGAAATAKAEVTDLTASVSGLANGSYSGYIRPFIKLDGVRYYGNSSETVSFVIGKSAPVITSTASTAHSVQLTWDQVDYADEYHAYIYNTTTGKYNRKGTLDHTARSFIFTDLEPNTTYTFKVRSYYPNGEYKYSAAVKVKTKSADTSVISKCKVTIPYASYTYRGRAIKPTVTVKDNGIKLTNGTDYTLTYSNNTNVGTATITVKGKGYYSGSFKKTFTVKQLDVSTAYAKATIPSASYIYTGQLIKPAVTLRFKDGSVIPADEYTYSYSNNKAVGQAVITVKGKSSNVCGTLTRNFIIKPETNAITLISSPGSGYFRLDWKKGTAGTVGYQVLYSTTSDFSANVHSWTTTNVNDTTENFKKVPVSGQTWYVKVKSFYTADGTATGTRYGTYSAVKSVTVK